jgi:hypothetical protein
MVTSGFPKSDVRTRGVLFLESSKSKSVSAIPTGFLSKNDVEPDGSAVLHVC